MPPEQAIRYDADVPAGIVTVATVALVVVDVTDESE